MRPFLPLVLFLAACGTAVTEESFPREVETAVTTFHDLRAPAIDGADTDLAAYRGKVVLVVNVASECGFTGQYEGLQALHDAFAARGFSVLGFPSNEFGGQEPGSELEIREFCTSTFGVTFPMFAKVETKKGPGQSPVYAYLTAVTGREPGWNFCKYVVGRDGRVRAFFNSFVTPEDAKLRATIEAALAE